MTPIDTIRRLITGIIPYWSSVEQDIQEPDYAPLTFRTSCISWDELIEWGASSSGECNDDRIVAVSS